MLRYLPSLIFSFLLFSLPSSELGAQYRSKNKKVKHRFNAGLTLGLGLSQIDGDNYTGFDKPGFRVGARGSMFLNDRLDLVVGLLYNQKGSAISILNQKRGNVIHLDYMEVPLLISFKTSKDEVKRFVLEAGVSYSRLINYRIDEFIRDQQEDISFSILAERFKSDEFSVVAGFNYFFSQHIGLGIVYTFQLNETYSNAALEEISPSVLLNPLNNNSATSKVLFLKNYQVAFRMVYNIF